MARIQEVNKGDINPVGMIAPSALSEGQFQALNGTTWVLADGRSVAGSKYATITGSSTVPDLRGMVLRGKNNGRADGNQNPGGDLGIGTFQDQQVISHTHVVQAGNAGGGGAVVNQIEAGQTLQNNVPRPTESTGGGETRGRNVTVNHFIKIN